MEPVSRESDRGRGVHHHVHQWVIILCIVGGVALLLALFVLQQRSSNHSESVTSQESASEWSYDEKLEMLSDLNTRAEEERNRGVGGSTD